MKHMEIPKKMVVTSDLEKSLIFKSLKKSGAALHIDVNGIEYSGVIEAFDDSTLTIRLQSTLIGELGDVNNVNFVFNNNYHYFPAAITPVDEYHLTIFIPEIIYKNILRQYERINVFGSVYMKFKIMIQSEKKEMENSTLLDERVIIQEVKKPRPSIDKLLVGIKNLVSEYAQKFQVKVFKQDEKLSYEEKVIKDTKKSFLIYDSYEDSIGTRRFYDENILTVAGAYEYYIRRGEVRKAVEAKLIDLLQLKRNSRIFSECFVPLMLEGEAVGYVRLTNDVDFHRSIKPPFIERTLRYADILVEALVKYDYFSLETGTEHDIPIVNISGGGLLFRLQKEQLRKYLIPNTVIQMSIRFPERQIEARGVVHRIDEENSEYGVKFQEINEIDRQFIEEVVKRELEAPE
jgi:hypothetical protein